MELDIHPIHARDLATARNLLESIGAHYRILLPSGQEVLSEFKKQAEPKETVVPVAKRNRPRHQKRNNFSHHHDYSLRIAGMPRTKGSTISFLRSEFNDIQRAHGLSHDSETWRAFYDCCRAVVARSLTGGRLDRDAVNITRSDRTVKIEVLKELTDA